MKTNNKIWKRTFQTILAAAVLPLTVSQGLKAQSNTAYGTDALRSVTTGLYNSAFGYKTLYSNTTGEANTASGVQALGSNIDGSHNTAHGLNALYSNKKGGGNTANGAFTLEFNTTGDFNTASGGAALQDNTIGSGNTASGTWALHSNITGSNNTALGYYADVTSGGLTNATAIGYNAKVSSSNTMQFGDNNVTKIYAGVGNAATLVAGGLQITGGSPAAGRVLTAIDASGLATWQTPAVTGWGLTGNASTVDGRHFIGTTDNVPFNIRVNNQKSGRIDLNGNAFYGYLGGNNTTGAGNTASGSWALYSNTTGLVNTASGYLALYSNITGFANTASGSSALYSNTTGGYNTALGYKADVSSGNLTNATAIGANAQVGASNTIQLGDNKVTKVYAGVGNTATVVTGGLQVTGGTPAIGKVLISDASGVATWQTISNSSLADMPTATFKGRISPGTGTPEDLTVAQAKSLLNLSGTNTGDQTITLTGDVTGGGTGTFATTLKTVNSNIGTFNSLTVNEKGLVTAASNIANEVPLIFSTGLTRQTNTITNNLSTGIAGGQSVIGGIEASESLTLSSTKNATKGKILFGASAYDEASNKLGIGTSSPAATLDVKGNVKIVDGTQGANKVLTSDANGVATWETPAVTGWGLTGNTGTVDGTHFIGTTDNIPFNIRVNNQKAGRIDANNTFYGYQSGNNLTTGGFNTAGGYQALYTNTTGDGNTAIGREAMKQNNTGNNNTAIGSLALNSNTSGNFNTAVGYNADVDEKLTNATALGHAAWVDESNKIVLGNTGVKTIGGYANWSNLSDARFKKNIQQDVPGLSFITKLNPITYNLDIKKLNSFLGVDERYAKHQQQPSPQQAQAIATKEAIRYTGFLAQEVEQAAQAVNYNFSGVIKPASDKGHYNMSYSDFVVPLVKAVQEQQAQIEEQKQLIEQMQKEKEVQQQINQQLQQRLEALEKILANNGKNTIAAPKTSSEAVSSQELHLYPNPTSGVFTVTAEHINSGVIEVHNMAGNLIKQLPVKSKLVNYVLDFSGYAKGSYIVTVSAGGKKYTKQVVVQ